MTQKSIKISTNSKVFIVLFALAIIGLYFFYRSYHSIMAPNVKVESSKGKLIYIPTGSTYSYVLSMLKDEDILIDTSSFKRTASRMGYPHSVKPGCYKITKGMSNRKLINMLRAGLQTPVKVTFNNVRTPEQIAGKIGGQIEADSLSIITLFRNPGTAAKYNLAPETLIAIFTPNTYEFFWTTSAEELFERMHKEYQRFWNDERLEKAAALNLSKEEVITLASIVEEESVKKDERPRIAGVYINRIRKGIPLQADPTIKFAVGDFGLRRILTKHLNIDSPYNTYKNRGIPPGPINSPSISAIDAVLNYEQHSYLYFCAKADFSGYHAFARTLTEHNKNAREYQRALNRQRIYR